MKLNVIIPIAGNATRMFPASLVTPKSLFPVYNPESGLLEPVLLILLRQLIDACDSRQITVGKICIVASQWQLIHLNSLFFNQEQLEIYRTKFPKIVESIELIKQKIVIVIQKEQRGYGHAVLQAKSELENFQQDLIMVMLGDHIYKSNIQKNCILQMIETYLDKLKLFSEKESFLIEKLEKECKYIVSKSNYGMFSLTSLDICLEKDLHINGILSGIPINETQNDSLLITHTEEKPNLIDAKERLYIHDKKLRKKLNLKDDHYICYFGIEILPFRIFHHLEIQESLLKEQKSSQELNLRIGQFELMKEVPMIGVFIKGERLDTGLPLEYINSLVTFSNNRNNF